MILPTSYLWPVYLIIKIIIINGLLKLPMSPYDWPFINGHVSKSDSHFSGWLKYYLFIIMTSIEIRFKCHVLLSYWMKSDESNYLVSFVILNLKKKGKWHMFSPKFINDLIDVGENTLLCKQKIVTIWYFSILVELWYIMVDVWDIFCNQDFQLWWFTSQYIIVSWNWTKYKQINY
jgi:hypothetical protein